MKPKQIRPYLLLALLLGLGLLALNQFLYLNKSMGPLSINPQLTKRTQNIKTLFKNIDKKTQTQLAKMLLSTRSDAVTEVTLDSLRTSTADSSLLAPLLQEFQRTHSGLLQLALFIEMYRYSDSHKSLNAINQAVANKISQKPHLSNQLFLKRSVRHINSSNIQAFKMANKKLPKNHPNKYLVRFILNQNKNVASQ